MIESLQCVIVEIEKLPIETQAAIANRLLTELEDEKTGSDRFEATTDQQWDNLAVMIRQENSTGDTISLDEFFPPHPGDRLGWGGGNGGSERERMVATGQKRLSRGSIQNEWERSIYIQSS